MNEPKGAVLVDLMGALKRSLDAKPTFACGCPKDQVGGKPVCDFFQGDHEFCGECEHPEKCHTR